MDIKISERITITGCELMAAENCSGTIFEYLFKDITDDEKRILSDAGIIDDDDTCVVLRTIDGVYNDDSWSVGYKTAEQAMRDTYRGLRGKLEADYSPWLGETKNYLEEDEFFFEVPEDYASDYGYD